MPPQQPTGLNPLLPLLQKQEIKKQTQKHCRQPVNIHGNHGQNYGSFRSVFQFSVQQTKPVVTLCKAKLTFNFNTVGVVLVFNSSTYLKSRRKDACQFLCERVLILIFIRQQILSIHFENLTGFYYNIYSFLRNAGFARFYDGFYATDLKNCSLLLNGNTGTLSQTLLPFRSPKRKRKEQVAA